MIDQDHHYVPVFYLKQWAELPDNKVPGFRWVYGKTVPTRTMPEYTGFETNLYAQDKVPEESRHVYETQLFGTIDNGASKILAKLLGTTPYAFNPQDRVMWSAFLIASLIRLPTQVKNTRASGKATLTAELLKDPDDYGQFGDRSPEEVIRELIDTALAPLIENFGLHNMAKFITDYEQIKRIADLQWSAHTIPNSKVEFLTGDRPLLTFGLPENDDFSLLMALSPRRMFVAAKSKDFARTIIEADETEFAQTYNTHLITRAEERVYGRADITFVDALFKASPKRMVK